MSYFLGLLLVFSMSLLGVTGLAVRALWIMARARRQEGYGHMLMVRSGR